MRPGLQFLFSCANSDIELKAPSKNPTIRWTGLGTKPNSYVELRKSGGSNEQGVSFVYNSGESGADSTYLNMYNGEGEIQIPPMLHSETTTKYGGGTANSYGHVKLSDSYTSSGGAASNSVGASSKAVVDSYKALNNALSNKTQKTNSQITSGSSWSFDYSSYMFCVIFICRGGDVGVYTCDNWSAIGTIKSNIDIEMTIPNNDKHVTIKNNGAGAVNVLVLFADNQ